MPMNAEERDPFVLALYCTVLRAGTGSVAMEVPRLDTLTHLLLLGYCRLDCSLDLDIDLNLLLTEE
jgi:hypothetical protein